jgi:hypothetical protein
MTAASFGYIGDKPTISTRVGNRTLNAEQQTISNPSIERIAAVFPEDMCGAIRSHSGKAGITMTFPYDVTSQVACLMSLDILAHKVASLAMNLFGIHVETDGGLRYIVLAHGVRCVPGQEMSFQGVGADAINTLLGPHIHSWVAASPARREEVKQAIIVTRCITMQISRRPDEGAILNINMSLEGGYKTKDILF